jgi:SAM-dependent methyltransferase
VLGIDPSRNMIDFAREHYATATHPNLCFDVGDARNLGFAQAFDRIVSFNAVHWVPEQAAVLCSIRTALKPDGEALLRFVPAGPRTSLEDVIEEVCALPQWSAYFKDRQKPYVHSTPEAYRALAEANGLEVLRLDVEDKAWDFGSRQSFFDFCHVTFAEWTRFLPERECAKFITEVLDRYEPIAASDRVFRFYQMEVALAPMLES